VAPPPAGTRTRFLDPTNGGYGQVAVVVAAITVGFLGLAWVDVAAGNARQGDETLEARVAA
jgi:hypothetical protein